MSRDDARSRGGRCRTVSVTQQHSRCGHRTGNVRHPRACQHTRGPPTSQRCRVSSPHAAFVGTRVTSNNLISIRVYQTDKRKRQFSRACRRRLSLLQLWFYIFGRQWQVSNLVASIHLRSLPYDHMRFELPCAGLVTFIIRGHILPEIEPGPLLFGLHPCPRVPCRHTDELPSSLLYEQSVATATVGLGLPERRHQSRRRNRNPPVHAASRSRTPPIRERPARAQQEEWHTAVLHQHVLLATVTL